MSYFKMVDNYEQMDDSRFSSNRGLTMTEDVFSCHFPTFPVLPGVLILEMSKQTIEKYFDTQSISDYTLLNFNKVKFRNFARPGDLLNTKIIITEKKSDTITFSVKICTSEKKIASINSILYRIRT